MRIALCTGGTCPSVLYSPLVSIDCLLWLSYSSDTGGSVDSKAGITIVIIRARQASRGREVLQLSHIQYPVPGIQTCIYNFMTCAGRLGFDCRKGLGFFSPDHRDKTGSGALPAPYPVGTRGFSLGVKWPGREADHSPPSDAEIKNAWSYTSTSLLVKQYDFMAWYLVKHWDRFNFYSQ
jgi:hypothetical protein